MISHVYHGVCASPCRRSHRDRFGRNCRVAIKTDGTLALTSAQHRSGTERVHEVSNFAAADVYLNVQGDGQLTSGTCGFLADVMADPTVQVGAETPYGAGDIANRTR
jgi:hypothetical protein